MDLKSLWISSQILEQSAAKELNSDEQVVYTAKAAHARTAVITSLLVPVAMLSNWFCKDLVVIMEYRA
jgi:hypothetical protein